MKPHVLILGSNGAQGERYRAILNQANTPWYGIDVNTTAIQEHEIASVTHIIIATPTGSHAQLIRHCLKYRVPILCEKPVCKNLKELKELLHDVKQVGGDLSMVFQYAWLATHQDSKNSYYDYFRHGKDGLLWDCLQIIALAKGNVILREKSPVWKCAINGVRLNIKDMDQAYVLEVMEWLKGTRTLSLQSIYRIHEKVAKHKL